MWLTALILGFTGSLHCVGMCSPLVVAVSKLRPSVMVNRFVYNVGRILTYGILGASISIFGSLFNFPKIQNTLSIVLGIACVVMGLVGVQRIQIPLLSTFTQKISLFIKSMFGRILSHKTWMSISLLGMINGLLPCGLTSLALTNCILLPTPGDGFLFMLIFGLGTFPVMLGLAAVLQTMAGKFNFGFAQMTRVSLIALGLLLISRGFLIHPQEHPINASNGVIEICR